MYVATYMDVGSSHRYMLLRYTGIHYVYSTHPLLKELWQLEFFLSECRPEDVREVECTQLHLILQNVSQGGCVCVCVWMVYSLVPDRSYLQPVIGHYKVDTPRVSTICLSDITTCDQISQAFPLRICILQVIKEWRWERPGNTVRCCMCVCQWECVCVMRASLCVYVRS